MDLPRGAGGEGRHLGILDATLVMHNTCRADHSCTPRLGDCVVAFFFFAGRRVCFRGVGGCRRVLLVMLISSARERGQEG